ncbi:MAG TPA: hypothetical protein IAA58_12075 [Candidatus Gallacutalibacter stercoravium]|nr:hypothetical protein [Candidatus Gallacutalibacter stercoravium]
MPLVYCDSSIATQTKPGGMGGEQQAEGQTGMSPLRIGLTCTAVAFLLAAAGLAAYRIFGFRRKKQGTSK